ncbi:MAG: glycosyltransferase family 39 protein [Chloroflexia bacterium]
MQPPDSDQARLSPPQTDAQQAGIALTEAAQPPARSASPATDLRNLGIIIIGWFTLLLVLPPQHEYPILDDWIYAGSVQHQLATGTFAMPDRSQANLVGLTLWGTAWARALGFSYTTLTYSTLAFALLALLAFYGVARALSVPPAGALLGAALLAINPLFLHFSYSFMTDIPFLALVLCACYAYIRGLQGRGNGWLWVAGFCAGWGFLIRQFAGIVPLAFLLYVALDAVRARRLLIGRWLGIAVVPALFLAGWWLWAHNMPPSGATLQGAGQRAAFLWKEKWIAVFLVRALACLPLVALSACAALTLRRRRWWLAALWAMIVGCSWAAVNGLTENLVGTTEPPFTVHFGPIAFDLPQQIDTFVGYGNLVRVEGFAFFEYQQQALWNPEAWRLIFVLGTALGVLLLAKVSDGFLDWLQNRGQYGRLTPLTGVYLVGLAVFVASLALPGDFFDRYLLGFVPFVILFVVRGAAGWSRWAWRYTVAALTIWALGVILLQGDFIDHDNARWQAGQWLAARVQPVHVGYDWDNIRGSGNGTYEVADVPLPGFRVEERFPYTNRLSGFATRYVLAEARTDQPPLPAPVRPLLPVAILGADAGLREARGVGSDATGHVYIADNGNHRIVVLGPDGKLLTQWGGPTDTSAPGKINLLGDLAVSSAGHVLTIDSGNGDLQEFAPDGQVVRYLAGLAPSSGGIALGPDGQIWIADTAGGRVLRLAPDGHIEQEILGGAAGTPERLNQPVDVAVAPDGTIYVVDMGRRLVQLDAGGQVVREWPVRIGFDRGGSHLAVWKGQVVMSNPDSAQLTVLDPATGQLSYVGGEGTGPGQFRVPVGLAAGPENRLYVLDSDNARVQVFDDLPSK